MYFRFCCRFISKNIVIMTLIFSKKEKPHIYFGLSIALLAVFYAGVHYVNYYPWVAIPALLFTFSKALIIIKNPEVPVIQLDNDGITTLPLKKDGTSFYAYRDIESVKMQSIVLNGHIKLKEVKRKIIIDSVAIPKEKQQEIVRFINNRI